MKLSTARDNLFYKIDGYLPRHLAIKPYQAAYRALVSAFSSITDHELWIRNSVRSGNFVFGVSDLDLTLILNFSSLKKHYRLITDYLNRTKRLFPFLGEVNVYIREDIRYFNTHQNYYEGLRDPELLEKYPSNAPDDILIEKIVFLSRMIYSDRVKIFSNSKLRQKKWKGHLQSLGISAPGNIDGDTILACLAGLIEDKNIHWRKIKEDLKGSAEFADSWRFILPHKYLWYKDGRSEDLSIVRGTFLEKVCLRQLDWEVWGLFSQLIFQIEEREGFFIHLDRLMKLHWELTGDMIFREKVLRLINLTKKLANNS